MKVLSSVHIGEGEDIKSTNISTGRMPYIVNQRKLIDLLNSCKDSFEKYLNFIEKPLQTEEIRTTLYMIC